MLAILLATGVIGAGPGEPVTSALVTLAQAKAHLRITSDREDLDVALKLDAASEIVIDYIKRPDHGWTDSTVPFLVKAAVLIVLGNLYEDREGAGIPKGVKDILWRYRDPALA